MVSRAVRTQEERDDLGQMAQEVGVNPDILEEFAELQDFRSQPKVDLQAGRYVSLFRFQRAEQGGKVCPFGIKGCDFTTSCTFDPCLRDEMTAKES